MQAFVDLPEVETELTRDAAFGEIESTKTVADLHALVGRTVVEVSREPEQQPDLVSTDPYGTGWIVLVDASQPWGEGLLDAAARQCDIESR